jgi:hypothetical protein
LGYFNAYGSPKNGEDSVRRFREVLAALKIFVPKIEQSEMDDPYYSEPKTVTLLSKIASLRKTAIPRVNQGISSPRSRYGDYDTDVTGIVIVLNEISDTLESLIGREPEVNVSLYVDALKGLSEQLREIRPAFVSFYTRPKDEDTAVVRFNQTYANFLSIFRGQLPGVCSKAAGKERA